ncbi:MAG TPA: hypothetical protein VHA53_10320 [Nitrolancea sp.]|nr:hypothetical protein [Nitrolancea sp.]
MGNSNSGILGTLFSLLFKRNRNNSLSAMTDQPEPPREHHSLGVGFGFASMMMSGKLDDAFIARIEHVIEHSGQRLNPEMVQQIISSEQFRERLDPAAQERIRAALARVTGQPAPDASPAPLTTEPPAGPSPSAPSAWQPDARTTGDANWQPDAVIKGDDPWHPGAKTDDPWHPGTGSKKNDPWHPGD